MAGPVPLVAVTGRRLPAARVDGWADDAAAIQAAYTTAVERAGGVAAVVPAVGIGDDDARALLERVDALVLTGGADVDPHAYGAEPHPEVYGTDPVADAFELAVVRAAIGLGLPTLAICRGLQVLNVARGGDLDQHITGRPGLGPHGHPGRDARPVVHEVDLDAGSLVATAVGGVRPRCACHHHQAVGRLGDGLRVTGRAADGVVEALELPGAPVLAVQWHPEETAATDPDQQRLFDALLDAARR